MVMDAQQIVRTSTRRSTAIWGRLLIVVRGKLAERLALRLSEWVFIILVFHRCSVTMATRVGIVFVGRMAGKRRTAVEETQTILVLR